MPVEDELRQDVGARNPHNMINLILKNNRKDFAKEIKDIHNATNATIRGNLIKQYKDYFKNLDNMDYEQLFDPFYKSPIYPTIPDNWSEANLLGTPGSTNCQATSWSYYSGTVNIKAISNEACQGAAADCYFIAALCSLAWVNYKKILPYPYPSPTPTSYTIYFWNTILRKWEPQTVTANIRKDQSGNYPFATGVTGTGNTLWPAIYEKAYSAWLSNKDPTCPEITNSGGNPITALIHLTSKSPSSAQVKNTTDSDMDSGTAICEYLKTNCCYGTGPGRRTVRPTVAYTYLSAYVNPHNNLQEPGYPQYQYNNAAIAANHSYSILGIFEDITTGKKYIILRNPYGPVLDPVADPQIIGSVKSEDLLTGIWAYKTCDYFELGVCKPSGTPTDAQITMSFDDGIFGLECDCFRNHFQTFGWVPI